MFGGVGEFCLHSNRFIMNTFYTSRYIPLFFTFFTAKKDEADYDDVLYKKNVLIALNISLNEFLVLMNSLVCEITFFLFLSVTLQLFHFAFL